MILVSITLTALLSQKNVTSICKSIRHTSNLFGLVGQYRYCKTQKIVVLHFQDYEAEESGCGVIQKEQTTRIIIRVLLKTKRTQMQDAS